MDTQQITRILSGNEKTKHIFIGVFAKDQLPTSIKNFPACFVVNTDASTEEGSHWLAFYMKTSTDLCFFDSFGYPPEYFKGEIAAYVKSFRLIEFNPMRLQSPVSSVCGQYCIYYLYSKCSGRSLKDLLLSFIPNQLCNDLKVHQFVTKHFRTVVPFYQ